MMYLEKINTLLSGNFCVCEKILGNRVIYFMHHSRAVDWDDDHKSIERLNKENIMLDETRIIERIIYHNPVVNKNDFPPLSQIEEEIMDMEGMTFDYDNYSLCYTYIRENNNSWFVDIYLFWETFDKSEIIRDRFIIAPGFMMTERDEKLFMRMLDSYRILFNNRVCDDYVKQISDTAPEINMCPYKNNNMALFHTYFASHKSGIRELLVKSGLTCIAMSLEIIDDWNIAAKNLEDAFGLPFKLLRKLNTEKGIDGILSTKMGRENALKVYKNYHHIMNDMKSVDKFQICYLLECLEEGYKADKKFLKVLGNIKYGWDYEESEYIDGEDTYEMLKEYNVLREKVISREYKTIFPKYPCRLVRDGDCFYEIYNLLRKYVENTYEFQKKMNLYAKKCEIYQYEDDEYEIVIPRTVKDIFFESDHQHNCLYTYTMDIIEGKKTVLFMRAKSQINKPLVTLEIVHDALLQGKGCCNRFPTEEQMIFIKKFAKEKRIIWSYL